MPNPNSSRSRLYNRERAHGFQTGGDIAAILEAAKHECKRPYAWTPDEGFHYREEQETVH